jgi:hypothetical protein
MSENMDKILNQNTSIDVGYYSPFPVDRRILGKKEKLIVSGLSIQIYRYMAFLLKSDQQLNRAKRPKDQAHKTPKGPGKGD